MSGIISHTEYTTITTTQIKGGWITTAFETMPGTNAPTGEIIDGDHRSTTPEEAKEWHERYTRAALRVEWSLGLRPEQKRK